MPAYSYKNRRVDTERKRDRGRQRDAYYYVKILLKSFKNLNSEPLSLSIAVGQIFICVRVCVCVIFQHSIFFVTAEYLCFSLVQYIHKKIECKHAAFDVYMGSISCWHARRAYMNNEKAALILFLFTWSFIRFYIINTYNRQLYKSVCILTAIASRRTFDMWRLCPGISYNCAWCEICENIPITFEKYQ